MKKLPLIIGLSLLLALTLVGCAGSSNTCNCNCGCENCSCSQNASNGGNTSSANQTAAETPKYTVTLTSSTSASDDGKYGEAASTCSFTAVEPYVKDGKEYVKATQTMSVTANGYNSSGGYLQSYTPNAYQNSIGIDFDSSLSIDLKTLNKEVIAGGTIACDYYYPVGDYSDITVTFGYDGASIGKTQGNAVIHFEKN